MGDGRKACSACMNDDPRFVGKDDADALTCLVKLCASGVNYTSFPPRSTRPNLTELITILLG